MNSRTTHHWHGGLDQLDLRRSDNNGLTHQHLRQARQTMNVLPYAEALDTETSRKLAVLARKSLVT